MAKCLQMLVVLSKVSPANVPSAIVIAVGSLINTTPTDVLSINTGNSVDATGIGVVVHFGVALVSRRDATSLVLTPEIEKGQGTVSFTFPGAPKDDRRSPMLSSATWAARLLSLKNAYAMLSYCLEFAVLLNLGQMNGLQQPCCTVWIACQLLHPCL